MGKEKTIMSNTKKHQQIALLVVAASLLAAPMALADVVTDWNIKAGEIVVEAKLGPPPANRVLAIVHTAVYEAVNAITKRYPASELALGCRVILGSRDDSGLSLERLTDGRRSYGL
jgi:hypothetical protein